MFYIRGTIKYVSICYCCIANVSINSCLLTNLEERLQVNHQTSSFTCQELSPRVESNDVLIHVLLLSFLFFAAEYDLLPSGWHYLFILSCWTEGRLHATVTNYRLLRYKVVF